MSKIYVVYWSQTGNTEAMANAVAEGIQAGGKEAQAVEVSQISPSALKEAPVFAMGCPAMGAEVLEESEMEPFVMEVESFAQGKQIGLFGSYGWGDGEWMRDWESRMSSAGAAIVGGEGVITQETPDEMALEACRNLIAFRPFVFSIKKPAFRLQLRRLIPFCFRKAGLIFYFSLRRTLFLALLLLWSSKAA